MSLTTISADSTINREPKVLVDKRVDQGGRARTVKAAVPAHQVVMHRHQPVFYTQEFRSVPLNLFRNSGSRYSGNIEQKSFSKMKTATLRVNVSLTGGDATSRVELAPVCYWWDRIEIRSANGSSHLGTIHNDQLAFNLNLVPQDRLNGGVMESANLGDDFKEGQEYRYQETRTFYIPLTGTFFDSEKYFANIQGDLYSIFTQRTPSWLVLRGQPFRSIVTPSG
jgi:hypothetical protein